MYFATSHMIEADDKWQVPEISLLGKSVWDKEVEDCGALFKLKEIELVFTKSMGNTKNNYF